MVSVALTLCVGSLLLAACSSSSSAKTSAPPTQVRHTCQDFAGALARGESHVRTGPSVTWLAPGGYGGGNTNKFDAIVIGGGIIGLASAYELALRGLKVTVIEATTAGAEQSTRNWGFVRQQARHEAELPIMIESNARWQNLEKELGRAIEWRRGGNVRSTNDAALAEEFDRWLDLAKEHGLESRKLTHGELEELCPGISLFTVLSIFTPSDGQADPRSVVAAYVDKLTELGVVLRQQCRVEAIVKQGAQITGVLTSDGIILSRNVVLAAGAGSGKLLKSLDVALPIRLVRGTAIATVPVQQVTATCFWTDSLGFRQTASGSFVAALSGRNDIDIPALSPHVVRDAALFAPLFFKNRGLFESSAQSLVQQYRRSSSIPFSHMVEAKRVTEIVDALNVVFPTLPWEASAAWSGGIDGTPDDLPIVGAISGLSGLIVATAMCGHGFGIGPAFGRIIGSLVHGDEPGHDLRPFAPDRFRSVLGVRKRAHRIF